eukprot:jgi/Bigna1/134224/aug1.24_g8932
MGPRRLTPRGRKPAFVGMILVAALWCSSCFDMRNSSRTSAQQPSKSLLKMYSIRRRRRRCSRLSGGASEHISDGRIDKWGRAICSRLQSIVLQGNMSSKVEGVGSTHHRPLKLAVQMPPEMLSQADRISGVLRAQWSVLYHRHHGSNHRFQEALEIISLFDFENGGSCCLNDMAIAKTQPDIVLHLGTSCRSAFPRFSGSSMKIPALHDSGLVAFDTERFVASLIRRFREEEDFERNRLCIVLAGPYLGYKIFLYTDSEKEERNSSDDDAQNRLQLLAIGAKEGELCDPNATSSVIRKATENIEWGPATSSSPDAKEGIGKHNNAIPRCLNHKLIADESRKMQGCDDYWLHRRLNSHSSHLTTVSDSSRSATGHHPHPQDRLRNWKGEGKIVEIPQLIRRLTLQRSIDHAVADQKIHLPFTDNV